MGCKGITKDREFAGLRRKVTSEEVFNLGGIDGEEGKTGMEFLTRPIRSFSQFSPQ